ncbi:DUF4956 domain-containing protein [Chryseobacterium salviniae]|uniref:DUF4956 domain-containing protein n=1 Tax=Chryseobacterium salviniae TaxID=3101750 RepID=A0ABU6HVQ1_9FLAO|nr:DUF4956 domain-containing protein [Chryseobacterium sp. T9W2-O]MEC3877142.1 DUF4956 domain-containing protein [Chryseobacterium sp. T9W2-O]
MLELLKSNSSEPSIMNNLIIIILSFCLCSLVAFTYEITTQKNPDTNKFIQSLIFIGVVSTTIVMAIGDSLARGLGLMGALAMIRFRTNIRNPRNIAFMFAIIMIGISCGVFGVVMAIIGTVTFCIIAVIFKYSPLSTLKVAEYQLQFTQNSTFRQEKEIALLLETYCKYNVLFDFKTLKATGETSNGNSFERYYWIELRKENDIMGLMKEIEALDGVEDIKFRFINENQNQNYL